MPWEWINEAINSYVRNDLISVYKFRNNVINYAKSGIYINNPDYLDGEIEELGTKNSIFFKESKNDQKLICWGDTNSSYTRDGKIVIEKDSSITTGHPYRNFTGTTPNSSTINNFSIVASVRWDDEISTSGHHIRIFDSISQISNGAPGIQLYIKNDSKVYASILYSAGGAASGTPDFLYDSPILNSGSVTLNKNQDNLIIFTYTEFTGFTYSTSYLYVNGQQVDTNTDLSKIDITSVNSNINEDVWLMRSSTNGINKNSEYFSCEELTIVNATLNPADDHIEILWNNGEILYYTPIENSIKRKYRTLWTYKQPNTPPEASKPKSTWWNTYEKRGYIYEIEDPNSDEINYIWKPLQFLLPDAEFAGYIAGGFINEESVTVEIEKMPFSTESTSIITSSLEILGTSGTSFKSSSYGYFIGGKQGATDVSTNIEKLHFIFDSNVLMSVEFNSLRLYSAGVQSRFAGYVMGGYYENSIERMYFSNEQPAIIESKLAFEENQICSGSFGNEESGYRFGGLFSEIEFQESESSEQFTYTNVVEKLYYPTENTSSLSSTINPARFAGVGFSATKSGFAATGGLTSVFFSNVDKLDFSTDSISSLGNILSIYTKNASSFSFSETGYVVGGYKEDLTFYDTIESLDIINTTASVLLSTLNNRKAEAMGTEFANI